MEKVKRINKDKESLNAVKVGAIAKVTNIETVDRTKLRKLTAFGIFEGVEIKLIQKFPVNIIQVGYTQVALDKEVSDIIKIG